MFSFSAVGRNFHLKVFGSCCDTRVISVIAALFLRMNLGCLFHKIKHS
jgi:hypothetical protein